jgi:protease-4
MSESNQPQMSGLGPDSGRPPVNLSGLGVPPPPPPGYGSGPLLPPPYPPPPGRRGRPWLVVLFVVLCVLLVGSALLNVGLLGLTAVSTLNAGAGGNVVEVPYSDGDASQRIVILPISGVIAAEKVQFVHQALEALKAGHSKPVALVLRVESPGGGACASDQIWHQLEGYRGSEKVPMVASFGSVAASGGYYVSCGADAIVAEPGTVTGSIGVIFDTFTIEQLLQKIGVAPEVLTATHAEQKDVANNPFRPWTEKDTAAVQPFLDSFHELFIQRVFEGRKRVIPALTQDQVRAAAHGQAYTAAEALKLQLIDAQGYLDDAITRAKSVAGIAAGVTPKVTVLQVRHSVFDLLEASDRQAPSPRALDGAVIRQWLDELTTPRIEYRWSAGAPGR